MSTTYTASLQSTRSLQTPASHRDNCFYFIMALASTLTVFLGFSRSFYLKTYFHTPKLPLLFHIHGLVFSCWMLFFVVQTWFVYQGRRNLHRQLGTAGAILAGLMVVLGVAVAFVSAAMGHIVNGVTHNPAEGCLFALFDIALFAVFVWGGFHWRFQPQIHQRLMLLSVVVALLPSAIARLTNNHPAIATPIIFAFFLAGPLYDLITRKRIHKAYLLGLLIVLLTGPPMRLALGRTALWHSFFTKVTGS